MAFRMSKIQNKNHHHCSSSALVGPSRKALINYPDIAFICFCISWRIQQILLFTILLSIKLVHLQTQRKVHFVLQWQNTPSYMNWQLHRDRNWHHRYWKVVWHQRFDHYGTNRVSTHVKSSLINDKFIDTTPPKKSQKRLTITYKSIKYKKDPTTKTSFDHSTHCDKRTRNLLHYWLHV